MSAPLIFCDVGEKRSGLPQMLADRGCAVTVERLDAGDYLLSAGFGIERKSASDLVKSVCSGRLLEQLDRLAKTYGCAALLIEGDSWEGDWRLKAPMLGEIYHEISQRRDMNVIYSPSIIFSARILMDLARREQYRGSAPPMPRPAAQRVRTSEDVLRSLPGVGQAGAKKLLRTFGSVRAVANATEPELQAALGPKRGSKAYEMLVAEA